MTRPKVPILQSRFHAQAFSLLEVLAALLLLVIIATSLMTGKTRLLRQGRQAEQRLEIASDADTLIQSWWTNGTPPVLASGVLKEGYIWTTHPRRTVLADGALTDKLPFQVTRFCVYEGMKVDPDKCILELDMLIPQRKSEMEEAR